MGKFIKKGIIKNPNNLFSRPSDFVDDLYKNIKEWRVK